MDAGEVGEDVGHGGDSERDGGGESASGRGQACHSFSFRLSLAESVRGSGQRGARKGGRLKG